MFFVASATTAADFVNRSLYRDGKGLFPVPLAGPAELTVDPLDNTPDVQSEDHPVFRNIGNRAGYISKIYVKQYFALRQGLECQEAILRVRVIMRLAERRAAAGGEELRPRPGHGAADFAVVAIGTIGSSDDKVRPLRRSFRTWCRIFPAAAAGDAALQVGDPKIVAFPSASIEPTVRFEGPGGDATAATIEAGARRQADKLTATFAQTSIGRLLHGQADDADEQDGNPRLRRECRSGRRRLEGPERRRPELPARARI